MFYQLSALIVPSLVKGSKMPGTTAKQNLDPAVYCVNLRVKILFFNPNTTLFYHHPKSYNKYQELFNFNSKIGGLIYEIHQMTFV
jgi:hypothetical protein